MSQLTSIAKLRNSPAMQSRVETVMRYLQSLNKDWQAEWAFPIAIINVSNGQDDCTWVRDHTGTHIKADEVVKIGNRILTADHIINNLKGVRANSAADLDKVNDAIVSAVGVSLSWTHGMVLQPQGVAAEPTPFSQSTSSAAPASPSVNSTSSAPARSDAVNRKAAPKKSSSIKPIATKASPKRTKLDQAKTLFADLTPKQKVELSVWVQEKVGASKACQALTSTGINASA